MRRILIPIGGIKTDGNGNLSVDLGLERTGDWRDIKVALQTSGFAEWGLLSAGTPLTFGRGRRATLGPELLEPQDTLTLQVTGGPPLAQVTGAVSGVGGTMDEIMQRYAPSPNTIALDTASPIIALKQNAADSGIYVVAAGGTVTNAAFIIPTGVQSVRFEINQLGALAIWTANTIIGNVTGKQYNTGSFNPGNTGGFDETWELDPEDTQLLFSINATSSANPFKYWLNGHLGANFVAAKIVANVDGEPVFVRNDSTPALWQSFPNSVRIDVTSTGVDVQAIAGVANQRIYLGPATIFGGTGARYAFKDGLGGSTIWVQPIIAGTPTPINWKGRKLSVGNGLYVNVGSGSEIEFSGNFNQG